MTVDVVCAGSAFLDIVFRGVPRIPQAGEEVLASGVVAVPGAMANVAYALRQLGLEAVVCSPIGTDPPGRLLQDLMAEAGVPWIGEPADATSLSVALPIDGDRAFVTVQPDAPIDLAAVAALAPRAVVANLPLPGRMPTAAWIYGVVGDPQVAILRAEGPRSLSELRTLVLNEREARDITGRSDTVAAAAELAARGCLVVVTRGADGAVAADPDGTIRESAAVRRNAQDTVGAGDLFTAAFIWADLLGRSVDDRLDLANAYASLSLAEPVPRQKGLAAAVFLEAMSATETPMDRLLEV